MADKKASAFQNGAAATEQVFCGINTCTCALHTHYSAYCYCNKICIVRIVVVLCFQLFVFFYLFFILLQWPHCTLITILLYARYYSNKKEPTKCMSLYLSISCAAAPLTASPLVHGLYTGVHLQLTCLFFWVTCVCVCVYACVLALRTNRMPTTRKQRETTTAASPFTFKCNQTNFYELTYSHISLLCMYEDMCSWEYEFVNDLKCMLSWPAALHFHIHTSIFYRYIFINKAEKFCCKFAFSK